MNKFRRIIVLAATSVMWVVGVGVSDAGATAAHSEHALTTSATATKKLNFTATYVGNVKILWGATKASGTMSGAGKATSLGVGAVSALGATMSFSTSASSDPVSGSAVLKGPGGSISVKTVRVTASTSASATPTAKFPDPVSLNGTVKVTKGTGKFAGATGTLSVHATFTVNTVTGTETQKFNATLKGSLSVKA